MDTHNLATVIAPNILKERPTATVGMDDSSFLAIEAVNYIIEFNDQMCEVSDLITQMSADQANRSCRFLRIFSPF